MRTVQILEYEQILSNKIRAQNESGRQFCRPFLFRMYLSSMSCVLAFLYMEKFEAKTGAAKLSEATPLLDDPCLPKSEISVFYCRSIAHIGEAGFSKQWEELEHGPSPFLRYGFLLAMEESGSIGPGTGWYPLVIWAEKEGDLLGAVVTFMKSHSYGEFIFDWGWAEGSRRAGVPYYPKLVVASPVSPVSGNRILLCQGAAQEVEERLILATRDLADSVGAWSIHWLFCSERESEVLAEYGFERRASYQYHWHNRNYESFDDFLLTFRSRRRKQVRKERRKVREEIESIRFLRGSEVEDEHLDAAERFYRNTNDAHGSIDYLKPGFFHLLARYLPENFLFAEVFKERKRVAGAVFLESEKGLYGRYWGCDEEVPFLHFETAFYAGIERCIDRGIPLFEAGAQGEQKLLRGFEPSPTFSNHWIRHDGLFDAVNQFLELERQEVESHMKYLHSLGPYKSKD